MLVLLPYTLSCLWDSDQNPAGMDKLMVLIKRYKHTVSEITTVSTRHYYLLNITD